MSALIFDLMGVPEELIGLDYAITRIGTEPFREKLLPAALKAFGGGEKMSFSAATAAAAAAAAAPEVLDIDATSGLREFLSTDAEVMVDFVDRVRREYGGAEGYLTQRLGFSKEQVEQIREKLRPKRV